MNGNASVPVLLYHSVRDEPTAGFAGWEISVARFQSQLDQLAARGYTVIPLAAYGRWLRGASEALPEKPVVITFDDGFANFGDIVPGLLARKCPVTLFVPTAYVGGESSWLEPRFRRRMLTWSHLVDLDRSGIEIGAHAHVHRPVDTLRPAELVADVARSRDLIEEHLGHRCESFAYPHGYSSRRVRRVVAAAGFTQACAVKDALSGTGDDPMAVARVFVGWSDVGDRFDRLLEAGHRRRPRRDRLVTTGWRVARRVRARIASSGRLDALAGR